jgi:hypothetical protein
VTRFRTLLAGAALAAGLALASPAADAAEFAILIHETQGALAARTDPARAEAYWGAFAAYASELQAAGVLRGGMPLMWGDAAASVRLSGGEAVVAPPPAAPLTLGGWFVVEVASLEEAVAWAAKAPAAATGAVEVRPAFPAPAMR